MKKPILLMGLLVAAPLSAQSSSSFILRESVLNARGHPQQGVHLISPMFRVTLGAVGDAVSSPPVTGPFGLLFNVGIGSGFVMDGTWDLHLPGERLS